MIIYNERSHDFLNHVYENKIGYVLKENMLQKTNKVVSDREIRSWEHSLPEMARIIRDANLSSDADVLLEYKLPSTEKRIDFLIAGCDESGKENVLIIELKQWQKAELAEGDGVVSTFLGGRVRETVHPSYQATSYRRYLQHFNESLYHSTTIHMHSCDYLHNYIMGKEEPLMNERYRHYLAESPLYFRFDDRELTSKVKHHVSSGNGKDIAEKIETGKIRPSKKLVETVGTLLDGSDEFVLLDEQKVAYEKVIALYNALKQKTDTKQMILIKGGPGTGKSVIGLHVMRHMLEAGANMEYITPNQAFREVLRKKLIGSSCRTEVRDLFKGSASYVTTPENQFDVLLCDEAHRLKQFGHMQKKIEDENQATHIIRSANLSVFFVDDTQVVSKKDVGSYDMVKQEAEKAGADVHTVELESQFRCSGSGNYIAWIDKLLDFEKSDIGLKGDFDFQIVDSPHVLKEEIVDKRNGRLVAGYAWPWTKNRKNNELEKDVVIKDHQFAMPWNDPNRIDWAIHPECENQVGCIHTVQGLEMDYIGVIIGKDLGYDEETDSIIVRREEFYDRGARPRKPKKDERDPLYDLVRNTYKTLLTRGMKGCYVYCCDEGLQRYIKRHM
ncbi:hypothetical protein SAMN05192534_1288 [Alteribacillus persepolensis]|uniref:AAA+ ATPase domain-containing protein n=1 Tax=Alteribacillus persepolensis TaxID=568899 RepID=A0A1G8J1F2_9BACI|nr:DUF2075 domain-containing protein [Alteribacillus persepolensis]SDI24941.1 hypothetical protein SAMN05192534_1288 [Alteribacillus persepolensis]